MDWLLGASTKLSELFGGNTFFKMLFYGVIISAIMTLAVGWSQGSFTLTGTFPFIAPDIAHKSLWPALMFVCLSFAFAFGGYRSDRESRDDILSPIRRKLVGYWQVDAHTWSIQDDKIEFNRNRTFCTIGIEDIGRKLTMHFDITNSDIFSDQALDITNVIIAFNSTPKKLIYFFDNVLNLKRPIGSGSEMKVGISFPFLAVLNMSYINEKIDDMNGIWYDVDNTILNIAKKIPGLDGVEKLNEAVGQGAITFRGALNFHRLPAIPGHD